MYYQKRKRGFLVHIFNSFQNASINLNYIVQITYNTTNCNFSVAVYGENRKT